MKVGLRGKAEASVGVKPPEYFWHTALYIKFLSAQQIIILVCVCMCQQTRVSEGFAAQYTDVLSNCSYVMGAIPLCCVVLTKISLRSKHNSIFNNVGTAVAQWLRRCATNRKVAGSIPAGVTGILH